MRLLHLSTMDEPAGLENRLFRFIKELAEDYKQDLLAVGDPVHDKFENNLERICDIKHYKYAAQIKIPRYPAFLRPYFVKRWIKNKRYEAFICYSQLSYPRLLKTLAQKLKDIKKIYYEGGGLWFKSSEVKPLLELFDTYIANSTGSHAMLNQKFGVSPEKITVIHNGIPLQDFNRFRNYTPNKRDWEHIGLQLKDKFKILYVGRLQAKKGVNILIRMMENLDECYHLMVVGDGPELDKLKELSKQLGVEDKVTFYGLKIDIVPFYKAGDLQVVPSVAEPMGNVLLEGGAAGLPIIAANIDGNPDLIEDGETGILLEPDLPADEFSDNYTREDFPELVLKRKNMRLEPPDLLNPDKLASVIKDLSQNSDQRKKLGTKLQNKIRNGFLVKHTIKKFENVLRD